MTDQTKWKSLETKSLQLEKPVESSFSAMFFTATLDCATSQIPPCPAFSTA